MTSTFSWQNSVSLCPASFCTPRPNLLFTASDLASITSHIHNCAIEQFALEMNRDHSVVFEIVSKYCISDSFVDHDGYSIFSKGLLPAVVDTMVI